MKTFISLLRGINVGGQKLIKMAALREMYTNLGLQQVESYLQSGNLVFTTRDKNCDELAQIISLQIKETFDFDVPILVLTLENLQEIVQANPFAADTHKDPAYMHVTFLASKPEAFNPDVFEERKQDGEEIHFGGSAIYLYCPGGYAKTKLNNNFFEARLKTNATTRNWKTTSELLKLALAIN
ncbi:MAG: DUF1697 domain-containing protein [Cyclobacteriaceae bacterium]|nr:DUF1697 domain-containing protein [Cyclobacteriaceae bacterium]